MALHNCQSITPKAARLDGRFNWTSNQVARAVIVHGYRRPWIATEGLQGLPVVPSWVIDPGIGDTDRMRYRVISGKRLMTLESSRSSLTTWL